MCIFNKSLMVDLNSLINVENGKSMIMLSDGQENNLKSEQESSITADGILKSAN